MCEDAAALAQEGTTKADPLLKLWICRGQSEKLTRQCPHGL